MEKDKAISIHKFRNPEKALLMLEDTGLYQDFMRADSEELRYNIYKNAEEIYEKGVFEAGGSLDDADTPKIYVADLKSYNEGKLIGEWIDLSEYNDGIEVQNKIDDLMEEYSKKYHDGDETEHAIHDYENFHSSLYSEYMGEDDYETIIQSYRISEEKDIPPKVLQAIVNDYTPDDLEEWVDDRYYGEFSDDSELAEQYVESVGWEGISNKDFYFDYDRFGRDLAMDYAEYDGHYFSNYKKGGEIKKYDLSKYERGGVMSDRDKHELAFKDKIRVDWLIDGLQEYKGQMKYQNQKNLTNQLLQQLRNWKSFRDNYITYDEIESMVISPYDDKPGKQWNAKNSELKDYIIAITEKKFEKGGDIDKHDIEMMEEAKYITFDDGEVWFAGHNKHGDKYFGKGSATSFDEALYPTEFGYLIKNKARKGIGYKISRFEKGGETIGREKIVEVLKDKLEDVLEDARQEYEGQEITGEEVEYESRDGFIPYTDGGYEYKFFTYGNHLTGSGKSLPTNTLDAELERVENLNYEYGKERFEEEYPQLVKRLGGIENVDYNSLFEAGYESEADDLDEFSRSDDDSIMFEIEAFYYKPENDRGIGGQHTIVLTGNVNMEAPYHRTGNYEDYIQEKFTFDSVKDLEENLDKSIPKIEAWFDGENYKEGKELKMGRFEKGGRISIEDVKEIEGDLKMKLNNQQRERIVKEYELAKEDYPDENWSYIVEDLIYQHKDNYAKGGKIYKIQQKSKYDIQPKWEDERFQTGGRKFLTYKQAQDFKKKLQNMSSSIQYKVVEDISKSDYAKGGQAPDEYTGESPVLGYVKVLRDFKSSTYKDMPKKGDILPFTEEKCDRYDVCHSVIAWYKGRGNEYSLKDEMRGLYDGEVEYTGKYFAKGGEVNKKENNEMLIGGLAGILFGFLLNK